MGDNKSAQSAGPITQHIPPIEISSGSVNLHFLGNIGDPHIPPGAGQPVKQVLRGYKKIEGVRVIMTDGTIKADYKGDDVVKGCEIHIWVDNTVVPNADIKLITRGNDLQVEFENSKHKFDREMGCQSSHGRNRYKYTGQGERISKVILKANNGTLAEFKAGNHQEIDRILIWAEEADHPID